MPRQITVVAPFQLIYRLSQSRDSQITTKICKLSWFVLHIVQQIKENLMANLHLRRRRDSTIGTVSDIELCRRCELAIKPNIWTMSFVRFCLSNRLSSFGSVTWRANVQWLVGAKHHVTSCMDQYIFGAELSVRSDHLLKTPQSCVGCASVYQCRWLRFCLLC